MKWLVNVSAELDKATKAKAKELGVSSSELIRKAVAKLLKDPSKRRCERTVLTRHGSALTPLARTQDMSRDERIFWVIVTLSCVFVAHTFLTLLPDILRLGNCP